MEPSGGTYRERSESWLRRHGIPISDWFPGAGEQALSMRAAREVMERAMVLTVIAASALSKGQFQRDEALEWLREVGIDNTLTKLENSYITAVDPTERSARNAGWRIESAWALAWVLGLTHDLGPLSQDDRADWFYEHIYNADTSALLSGCHLRSEPEIHEQFDLLLRLHWAVADSRLSQTSLPSDIDPSVVFERRFALQWLTDPETPWDETDMST